MENPLNASSQEELSGLLAEGKIADAEYQDLLATMSKPSPGQPDAKPTAEPQFRAFRMRVLTGNMIICAFGLPIGIALDLPYVWVLSIIGIVVGAVTLSGIKDSWLAGILDGRK